MIGMWAWRATGAAAFDFLREERAEDQLGALLNRALGGQPRAFRRALGVLWDERGRRVVEIEQGKLGRLLQRLGDGLVSIRPTPDRQEQRDLDRGPVEPVMPGPPGNPPPPPPPPQPENSSARPGPRERT